MLRGRYMAAASAIETQGIPVDVESLERLRENWESIKSGLVVEIDADFGCYVPTNRRTLNGGLVRLPVGVGQAVIVDVIKAVTGLQTKRKPLA